MNRHADPRLGHQVPALVGRRVALHVSGSIAAFKSCEIITSLRKAGAEVRVAMTPSAREFISATTFQSLSGNPVATELWADRGDSAGHGMAHIDLSHWAEVQCVAPATAGVIARLALGLADDAVTTTALACPAPLVVAPAMESEMWNHPATQANVATLQQRGAALVGPASGRLASGHDGAGRMAEPDEIVAAVARALTDASAAGAWLAGSRVVVTAGGTREPIDPIRYIGNRSSGKMGNALAEEAMRLGARVTLITAAPPPPPRPRLEIVEAATAGEMLEAVRASLSEGAVLIMAAAVADYRPRSSAPRKIKKQDAPLTLTLVPTADVLQSLRDHQHRAGLTIVGFAAETEDLLANAQLKLMSKGLDLIVANNVAAEGIGMGSDDNAVVILGPGGVVAEVPRAPKAEVARAVFQAVEQVRRSASSPVAS